MGQSFLISGGSGDIGQAVYKKLKSLGHTPIAAYATCKPDLENIIKMDLCSAENIAYAVDDLAVRYPDLSGVVLAASPAPQLGLFSRISDKDLITQLNVNVIGVHTLLAALVRKIFKKNKSGRVVGILTEALGDDQNPAMSQMGAYVIAKYGMKGVLKLLEADYKWLSVESVSPGFTETKMLKSFDDRFLEIMRTQKSFQTPEGVADEIVSKLIE